jgi:hypothetical protein
MIDSGRRAYRESVTLRKEIDELKQAASVTQVAGTKKIEDELACAKQAVLDAVEKNQELCAEHDHTVASLKVSIILSTCMPSLTVQAQTDNEIAILKTKVGNLELTPKAEKERLTTRIAELEGKERAWIIQIAALEKQNSEQAAQHTQQMSALTSEKMELEHKYLEQVGQHASKESAWQNVKRELEQQLTKSKTEAQGAKFAWDEGKQHLTERTEQLPYENSQVRSSLCYDTAALRTRVEDAEAQLETQTESLKTCTLELHDLQRSHDGSMDDLRIAAEREIELLQSVERGRAYVKKLLAQRSSSTRAIAALERLMQGQQAHTRRAIIDLTISVMDWCNSHMTQTLSEQINRHHEEMRALDMQHSVSKDEELSKLRADHAETLAMRGKQRIIHDHEDTITRLKQDLAALQTVALAVQKNYAEDTEAWTAFATSNIEKLKQACEAAAKSQETVELLRAFVVARADKLRD